MGKASGASTALDALDHTRCASVTKPGGFLPLGRSNELESAERNPAPTCEGGPRPGQRQQITPADRHRGGGVRVAPFRKNRASAKGLNPITKFNRAVLSNGLVLLVFPPTAGAYGGRLRRARERRTLAAPTADAYGER